MIFTTRESSKRVTRGRLKYKRSLSQDIDNQGKKPSSFKFILVVHTRISLLYDSSYIFFPWFLRQDFDVLTSQNHRARMPSKCGRGSRSFTEDFSLLLLIQNKDLYLTE